MGNVPVSDGVLYITLIYVQPELCNFLGSLASSFYWKSWWVEPWRYLLHNYHAICLNAHSSWWGKTYRGYCVILDIACVLVESVLSKGPFYTQVYFKEVIRFYYYMWLHKRLSNGTALGILSRCRNVIRGIIVRKSFWNAICLVYFLILCTAMRLIMHSHMHKTLVYQFISAMPFYSYW